MKRVNTATEARETFSAPRTDCQLAVSAPWTATLLWVAFRATERWGDTAATMHQVTYGFRLTTKTRLHKIITITNNCIIVVTKQLNNPNLYLLLFIHFDSWAQVTTDGWFPSATSHPRWNEFPLLLQDGCLPQIVANMDLKWSYRWSSAVIKLHHSINWPKDKAKKHFSALWCTNGLFTCALL